MLRFSIVIDINESLIGVSLGHNGLLVNDAFGFEDVPLIPIESIYASLKSLLDHELLDDHVTFAPLLEDVIDELVLAKVDLCLGSLHPLVEQLHGVLWCNNTIRPWLALQPLVFLWPAVKRHLSVYLLVDELTEREYGDRIPTHD